MLIDDDGDIDIITSVKGKPPSYIQTGATASSAGSHYVVSDLNKAIYKITRQ